MGSDDDDDPSPVFDLVVPVVDLELRATRPQVALQRDGAGLDVVPHGPTGHAPDLQLGLRRYLPRCAARLRKRPAWLLPGLVVLRAHPVGILSHLREHGDPDAPRERTNSAEGLFPSYAPIIGAVGGILVQTAIECAILAVALVFFGVFGPSWLLFPIWLILFASFVTACAVTLAILNVYFRDIAHLTNVVLQLLFFLTPIIYQSSSVPVEWNHIPLRAIVLLNPIALFVESLRQLSYHLQVPPVSTWLGMVAWGLGAIVVASFVYRRWGLDIGEAI